MQLKSILSLLLLASAFSLTIGGYLLYINSLVPEILVETTFVAVVVLFALSYFVARGNLLAVSISTVLGVVAPIMSAATPQHVSVLVQIDTGGLISILGLLQLFGFYIFPLTFVVVRIVFRSRLTGWI
ncbi:MAG: hypothetical protein JRN15_12870 [Nitrososphaerota archaeon]|jgi:hypothetical protein|nr:hypothetical protein [Nitrososphaerota archaeon]